MPTKRLPLATLCTAALLAGCAATPRTVFEGRFAMRDGWHRATVERIVPADAVPARLRPDCPPGSAANPASAGSWVLLTYRPAGRTRQAAAPLPAGAAYSAGEVVYLRVAGCIRALHKTGAGG